MKITESQVLKLNISGVQNLDPVNVMIENFGPGRGRITIECFGSAWSNAWGSMGEQHNMVSFFLSCDNHYLANKLKGDARDSETDYDAFKKKLLGAICKSRRNLETGKQHSRECFDEILSHDFEAETIYADSTANDISSQFIGDDWYLDMPTKPTSAHQYLHRIIDTIRAGLKQWQQEKALETQKSSGEKLAQV